MLGFGFGVVLLLAAGAWLWLLRFSNPRDPSRPPRGYPSYRMIELAALTRALDLVEMKPALPPGVELKSGIEYGRVGEKPLLLDLYAPARRTGPVPGLIFIHGGAWRTGKREDYRVYTTHFASRGFVVATVSYRLLREAPFPAAVQDVMTAVRWMRAHATELGVDPAKIAVVGGSAGGHLSMMAGYAADRPEFSVGSHSGVSSRVAAVVTLYGPYDLTTPFAKKAGVVKDFLGGRGFDEAPETWHAASPMAYLDSKAPPTLIFQGTLDEIVPVDQGDALAARLETLGVPHEYHRLKGWPHTMDAARPVNAYCRFHIERFLHRHLEKVALPPPPPLPKPVAEPDEQRSGSPATP